MGEVYLARDPSLPRDVAVKVLPAKFTGNPERVQRFEREARAVSALNHPNILTIHEISRDGGWLYMVTELVEGETLEERMSHAPDHRMQPGEAVEIARQIATALAAAHGAGVVHRDIKPANIMVRRDGWIKVIDFGAAKLVEPSPAEETVTDITGAGGNPGTPRYMSPEQRRGGPVDARSDLFSLGIILYEMLTGRWPFEDLVDGEPRPVAEFAPGVPSELDRVTRRALRKERNDRYQTAAEFEADLQALFEGDIRAKSVRSIKLTKRSLPLAATGPTRRSIPLIVGAGATAAVGTFAWRVWPRKPALAERDAVLLADIENKTGDNIFDGTLKQALSIQLEQSPYLRLFPEGRARETLRMMRHPPGAPVTEAVAREICVREGLKALIAGSIVPFGGHYAITLTAMSQNGEPLVREQVEAGTKEQVLTALSQGAARLREKLGESITSVQKFDKPILVATTSRLDALRAWSLGVEHSYAGRPAQAVPFYLRAVEIDPEFAHAYGVLSTVFWTIGLPQRAAAYAEKGYALRDTVAEYEKLRITNFYHGYATGNLEKRLDTLALLKKMYPSDAPGAGDSSITYDMLGQYDKSLEEAREAIRLSPGFAPAHRSLGWAHFRRNEFAEAKKAFADALSRGIDHIELRVMMYQIAVIEGDATALATNLNWMRERSEHAALDLQAGTAAVAGEKRKAEEWARRAIEAATARPDTREIAARYASEQALRQAAFGDLPRARADAQLSVSLMPGRASSPRAALAFALAGDSRTARQLTDEIARRWPEDTIVHSLWLPMIRAATELERGAADAAVESLQRAARLDGAAQAWTHHVRGTAYLRLRRAEQAAAEFQAILDHRGEAPLSPLYPLAHAGLGRAHSAAGDAGKARGAYQSFFAAWKNADRDLPLLVQSRGEFAALGG